MTVYRLVKAGELRALQIGKSYRLRQEDVDAVPSPAGSPKPANRSYARPPWVATTRSRSCPTTGTPTSSSGSSTRSSARSPAGRPVVDVAHEIAPHDVRAALAVPRPGRASTSAPASPSPSSTPGSAPTGGPSPSRSATARPCWSRPDNGLLAPAVVDGRRGRPGRRCSPTPTTSSRARSRPSPAATCSARPPPTCCNGVDLFELGDPIDPTSLLPGGPAGHRRGRRRPRLRVLWVDRYGNAQLNVDPDEVDGWSPASEWCGSGEVPHRGAGRRLRRPGPAASSAARRFLRPAGRVHRPLVGGRDRSASTPAPGPPPAPQR